MQQIPNSTTKNTGRWPAQFSGKFLFSDSSTRLGKTHHFGPLRVQRPFFPEGDDCLHFYLLHPPGGLVGGDCLSIDLSLESGAHVLMTTPSAGKIYRNISGFSQSHRAELSIADGAVLEYLPQENIVFDGAQGELHTQVEIQAGGVFIGWEITCLGRFESNDPFNAGHLWQSIEVRRDGRPLFLDRLILVAPSMLQTGIAGFQGRSVFGSFVVSANVMGNDAFTDALVAWQQSISGGVDVAMTQKPDVWIARATGNKAENVREVFEVLWRKLRPRVLGRRPCEPRIWRT